MCRIVFLLVVLLASRWPCCGLPLIAPAGKQSGANRINEARSQHLSACAHLRRVAPAHPCRSTRRSWTATLGSKRKRGSGEREHFRLRVSSWEFTGRGSWRKRATPGAALRLALSVQPWLRGGCLRVKAHICARCDSLIANCDRHLQKACGPMCVACGLTSSISLRHLQKACDRVFAMCGACGFSINLRQWLLHFERENLKARGVSIDTVWHSQLARRQQVLQQTSTRAWWLST